MSLGPQPERTADGAVSPLVTAKLLAYVALFLRLSLGLTALNAGLAGVLSTGGGGGPPGFGGRGVNPFTGGIAQTMPGFEGLMMVLPFAEMAVGVGLIFGIFTTASTLAGCAMTLVPPLLMAVSMITTSGIGGGPNRVGGGFGLEFFILLPSQPALSYAVLVLLSPTTINRLSIDALIFRRPTAPIFPVPPGPASPVPGLPERTASDRVDPA